MSRSGPANPNWRGGDWVRNERENARVYNAHRHAARHGVESTLTLDEWLSILSEYGRRCAYCFGPFEQLDHIKQVASGGPNVAENVVPACADCNKRKAGRSSGWVPSIASRFWPRVAEELYA